MIADGTWGKKKKTPAKPSGKKSSMPLHLIERPTPKAVKPAVRMRPANLGLSDMRLQLAMATVLMVTKALEGS